MLVLKLKRETDFSICTQYYVFHTKDNKATDTKDKEEKDTQDNKATDTKDKEE